MNTTVKWIRVTRQNVCPICKKPDWCSIAPQIKLIHCLRVPSDRPSRNSMGGYLHPLNGESSHVEPIKSEPPKPKINVTDLMREWRRKTEGYWVRKLANELGVSYESLVALGIAWCPEKRAWAFPMFSGWGEPVGIRLRSKDGKKFAFTGGHNGLFIPHADVQKTVWITEGPTSCAAALSFGFYAISRPSCNGSLDQIPILCKRLGIQRAILVADNDEDKKRPDGTTYNPGVDSTQQLSELMRIPCVTYVPPCKDLREGLKIGLTVELIQSTIKNLIWRQPK